MDVILMVGSLALSPYLPRYIISRPDNPFQQQTTKQYFRTTRSRAPSLAVSISGGISFLLLTLSVLEAIPSRWMLLLDAKSLPTAYRILFTLLVLLVFVIFPFAAGAQQRQVALENLWRCHNRSSMGCGDQDEESNKKKRFVFVGNSRFRNWCLKILSCIFKSVFRVIYFVAYLPARKLCRKDGRPMTTMSVDSTLPTKADTENINLSSNHRPTKNSTRTWTFIGGFCGIIFVFCIFRILGPCVVRTTDKTPILTVAISWLTAIGLLLSASINGFGSVSMPHSCLAGFYLQTIPPEAIAKAQEEMQRANESLQERKAQLASSSGLSVQSGASSSTPSKGRSFADIGEEVALRRKTLMTEIEFLETLVAEMKDETMEMIEMKEMAAGARTLTGRFKLGLGVVFSVILVVRLLSAVVFLWKHDHGGIDTTEDRKKSGSDLITMILVWLRGHHYVTQQHYNTLSQLISVILTAILSFSQVRTFWRSMELVDRWLHQIFCKVPFLPSKPVSESTKQSSSAAYDSFLACLMVCYFLSGIVLTKLMLPKKYRVAFAKALGDDDHETNTMFRIRSYAVNLTFTLSAFVTAFTLGILLGIQRQNTVRHLSVWKSSGEMEP